MVDRRFDYLFDDLDPIDMDEARKVLEKAKKQEESLFINEPGVYQYKRINNYTILLKKN